jgi:hypothetical protein
MPGASHPSVVHREQMDFKDSSNFMGTVPDAQGRGEHTLGSFHIRTKARHSAQTPSLIPLGVAGGSGSSGPWAAVTAGGK